MYKCPINYFTDNLIFNEDKSCWAVFKLKGYDYDYLDDENKIYNLNKTARFLAGTMSEVQILVVPVEQDNKAHFRALKNRLKRADQLYASAMNHAEQTEEYLEENTKANGSVNDYRFYLIVKLQEEADTELVQGMKDGYQYFIKSPVNAVNVFMNMDTKDILISKIKGYERLAQKWFYSLNQKITMEQVEGNEVQWLFRRTSFRGLNEKINLFYKNTKKEVWKPKAETIKVDEKESIIKPLQRDIINLFSGSITSKGRVITVEHDNKTSYQSFLVITNIPDVVEFPGTEWIYMLQQYNCQAEICIHMKAIEYRSSLRKIDLKKREINSQMEHIAEASADMPEDLLEGKEYSDALEMEIKSFREPILNASITICLASNTLESLEQKVTTVKNAYEDMNFVVERPLADQIKLFMQCIPSVKSTIRDYVMPLTPMTLASGIIGAIHELGDKIGPYIGTTGIERKQVFLDMGDACLRNQSASATFFGNLGGGKSFNANLLVVLNVLYGGYSFIFDPKGERSHWVKEFKLLEGMITTATLSAEPSNKGKLDPYNIYKDDINMANELMLSAVSELFKIHPTATEYTALLEGAKIIAEEAHEKSHTPSMLRLIDILDNFPTEDELCSDAKFLARRLRLQQGAGMSQLLIGNGTEEAIRLDNRLNILQIQNLKLPSPEAKKEDYTSEETLSTVLMMVISHFAKRWALIPRKTFKCILFDESWALAKTTEGVKLYDYLARMGRSLYTGCIFNGHSVLDIPTEGIKNTISYKFCFKTNSDSEAERMCGYLGLESTEDNKDAIKNLKNGTCFFRDLDGHVGILSFDAVFADIIDVFSTTPTTDEDEVLVKTEEKTEIEQVDQKEELLENFIEEEELEDDFDITEQIINLNLYKKEKCDTGDVAELNIDIFERENV